MISLAGPLLALAPVYQAGTPEQVERFVAPFLAGHGARLAALAFSEPEGSAAMFSGPAHTENGPLAAGRLAVRGVSGCLSRLLPVRPRR